MEDWESIAKDNLIAAKALVLDSRWRSAVSRAYYSAYAAITSRLSDAEFPDDREGPGHDMLPRLVMTYLSLMKVYERRQIATVAFRLYRQRLVADYRRTETVGERDARAAVRDAQWLQKMVFDA